MHTLTCPGRHSLGVIAVFCSCLALLLPARLAHAQSATDSATAESLFNEALALLAKQKVAEACPKLEASQRLDPGVGTLLYLADCYQQVGRSASAWATFREAAYMAKDRKDERESVAVESAKNLEPTLSYLTVEVTAAPGLALEIKRDGKAISDALWNTATPVDPGTHSVEASAPGKKPWSTSFNIAAGPRQESVLVPTLEDAPVVAEAAPPPKPAPEPAHGSSVQKTAGWVLLGVGSAGLVTGGILALLARGNDTDADAECRPDRLRLCNPAGVELSKSAHSKATWAGVSAGVGLAALGAGVTLLLTAPASAAQAKAGGLSLSAQLDLNRAELLLRRAW